MGELCIFGRKVPNATKIRHACNRNAVMLYTFVAQTESSAKIEDVCEKGSSEMMAVFLRG